MIHTIAYYYLCVLILVTTIIMCKSLRFQFNTFTKLNWPCFKWVTLFFSNMRCITTLYLLNCCNYKFIYRIVHTCIMLVLLLTIIIVYEWIKQNINVSQIIINLRKHFKNIHYSYLCILSNLLIQSQSKLNF